MSVVKLSSPMKCQNCETPLDAGALVTQLDNVAAGMPGGVLCAKCRPQLKAEKPKAEKPKAEKAE